MTSDSQPKERLARLRLPPLPAVPAAAEETGATPRTLRQGGVLRPLEQPARREPAAQSIPPGSSWTQRGERAALPKSATRLSPAGTRGAPSQEAPRLPLTRSPHAPASPLLVLLLLLLAALWLIGVQGRPAPSPGGLAAFPLPLALAPLLGLVLVLSALQIGVLVRLVRVYTRYAAPPDLSWSYLLVLLLAYGVYFCLLWLCLTAHLGLPQASGPLLCDLAALALALLLLLRALRVGSSTEARAPAWERAPHTAVTGRR